MNNHTFHHIMTYVLDKPICSKEQLQFEIDCIERKVQSIKNSNTNAYVVSRH